MGSTFILIKTSVEFLKKELKMINNFLNEKLSVIFGEWKIAR